MFLSYTKNNVNRLSFLLTILILGFCYLVGGQLWPHAVTVTKAKEPDHILTAFLPEQIASTQDNIWTVQIPIINLKATIQEGTSEECLKETVGHFSQTGKINGNIGLAAHNRGYLQNYFAKLHCLKTDDEIIYQYKSKVKKYKVTKMVQISSDDWSWLEASRQNKLTLITCIENEPQKRLCVQAEEIKE